MPPPLIAIIGPTASGKSALALALAEHLHAEILSVDSMQVYRHMDIGTAKPSRKEQARVRHHLIDIIDPVDSFTVARFVEEADRTIADGQARKVPLIAAGGTPMYFKALFEGLFEGPSADPKLRDQLNARTLDDLHAELSRVDPTAAARIHANDRKRLVRALEVFHLTGKPITDHHGQWGSNPRHPAIWLGLTIEREQLNRRINARCRAMFDEGWIDEVRSLLHRFGRLSPTASEAAGYSEIIDALSNSRFDEALEAAKISTRQLARRQIKWFRRFPDVRWIDATLPLDLQLQHAIAQVA